MVYAPEVKIDADYALLLEKVNVYYGDYQAVKDVTIPIERGKITAFIGPSGCGKSTVLKTINRMNDLVSGARVEGKILYRSADTGERIDLYSDDVDPVEVRRNIGIVFQKPNPFPKSIFENVAYGPRLLGVKGNSDTQRKAKLSLNPFALARQAKTLITKSVYDVVSSAPRAEGVQDQDILQEIVEKSLKGAALWDEVKNDLHKSGLALSGGQQQRLCIARTIAVEPDVILMDEPASALDPIATQRIEQLMREELAGYTIVIVTHNMQQAQRASDTTCFFNIRKEMREGKEVRWGELVEMAATEELFNNPQRDETRDYISGRFG